jgi:hypothetical protein
MVPHPGNPSQPRPSLGGFGRPRGLAATGRPWAAQGPQARFGMMRLDRRRGPRTRGRRRCLPWARILGALSPGLRCWGTLRLPPAVYASWARLRGAPWCALVSQCLASLKEPLSITALPRWQETQGRPRSRQLGPGLHRLWQASASLLATIARPHASTGSLPEPSGPSQGLRGRHWRLSLGLSFLSCEHARSARLPQRLQAEPLLESDNRSFPRQERLRGCRPGARGGLAAPPRGAGLAHWPAHAHRGFPACHEGRCCLRDRARTGLTWGHDTTIMMLCGRGRRILHVRRGASRALAS